MLSLLGQIPANWQVEVFAIDASTDSRTQVALAGIGVAVHSVPSDWYWAKSMSLAERCALDAGCDAVLWFNDDVLLDLDALQRVDDAYREANNVSPGAVVVASMRGGDGSITYGGSLIGRRVTDWHLIEPSATSLIEAQLAHGNMVMVPSDTSKKLGGLDSEFGHGYADFDFVLRWRRLGGKVFVAPGTFGVCERNSPRGTYLDRSMSRRKRWTHIRSPKGLPPLAHARYLRRHGGAGWPLVWVKPYVDVWLRPTRRTKGSAGIVTRHAHVDVTVISFAEALKRILDGSRGGLVVTPNLSHLASLERTAELAEPYTAAELRLPDGWPVVALLRLTGHHAAERVTGSDLMAALSLADGGGKRIAIVGGTEKESNDVLCTILHDAGWETLGEAAPPDELSSASARKSLIRRIAEFDPDITVIGVGSPKQEILGLEMLSTGLTGWIICAGAGIDFASGWRVRSPRWMRRTGLEWLFRAAREPRRLGGRYARDLPRFATVAARTLWKSGQGNE